MHWLKNCGSRCAIAQCEESESHFKYGFSAGLLVQQEAHEQVSAGRQMNSIFNSGCSQTGNNRHNRIQLHESHSLFYRWMAFLPLPDMAILLPLTSGACGMGGMGLGLSPHVVGIFEHAWTGSVSAGTPRSPPRKSSRRVSASCRRIRGSRISVIAALFQWPAQIFPSRHPAWAAGRRWSCPCGVLPGCPGRCCPDHRA